MGDQVELVNILQTEHFQSSEHFQNNVLNTKLSEFHKASRKRDKLILAFIIVQVFCVLLAVAVNFIYLNDNIERSVGLEKQIQQCTMYTSKLTSLDKQDDSGMRDLIKGEKSYSGNAGTDRYRVNTGEKGEKGGRGDNGLIGPIGVSGNKGEKGNIGSIGSKGQNGDNGTIGEQGLTRINGQNGEKGIKGEKGPIGDKGVTGKKGPNGDKGTVGKKGPTGMKGSMGDRA